MNAGGINAGDVIAGLGLFVTMIGGIFAAASWIVSMFWKIEKRLTRIEDRLRILPEQESDGKVIAMGTAVGRDYGRL